MQTPEGITISAELAEHLQYRDLLITQTGKWLDALGNGDKAKAAQLQAELGLIHAIMEGQRRELADEIAEYEAKLAAKAGPPQRPQHPPRSRPPTTNHRSQHADAAPRNRPPSAPPCPAGYKVLH